MERQAEDKILEMMSLQNLETKIQFMQNIIRKVYNGDIDEYGKLCWYFMRVYNEPVKGDFDKTSLPKILQKRRGEFGKNGQH